ncbi:MAG: hypothetical protein HY825_13970 [Acidobacteria bacterium]|nr:hypothetical protein [Acidobacteriota bacterium]
MRQLSLATSWGELRLAGGSRAGEGSLLLLPQLRLALDAGRPARALVPMAHVVVSHGHLDHLLGLPFWASQRKLQGIPGGVAHVPASLVEEVGALLALAARLEGGSPYGVELRGALPGDTVPVKPGFELGFFRTSHWVDTLGCRLDWLRRRLRPECAGLSPEELRQRRAAGVEIGEVVRTPLVAYLADTGPGVFDDEPSLADVEVLVVECTFLDARDRDRAQQFGHIHLDDVAALAPRLRNRHLVLTHLSRRHRLADGARLIRRTLAPDLAPRLHLMNVEWE